MAARLVVVSVDGLRPEGYLYKSGTLGQLAHEGAWAEALIPIYPSLTMPCHASIVTGTSSAKHGIQANAIFNPNDVHNWKQGESKDFYLQSAHFKAPPIWDLAEQNGYRTCVLHWPTSLGANVSWCLPEVFDPQNPHDYWEPAARHATPELRRLVERHPDFVETRDRYDLDRNLLIAFEIALNRLGADVVMLHIDSLDHDIHDHGRGSPRVLSTYAFIEEMVAAVFERVDLTQTDVLVFGDHGALNFTKRININSLFREQGWLDVQDDKIVSWKAIAHTSCATAPIYVREPALEAEVLDFLHANSAAGYVVLERSMLAGYDAFPEAICAIDSLPGYSMGQGLTCEFITTEKTPRGEHGHIPIYPELDAGLFARGPSFEAPLNLGRFPQTEIFPIMQRLLGLTPARSAKPGVQFTESTSGLFM
ncbi:MAG TPA: nucleotide pyrophosphatase/phosphodiesterase family protein [Bdellovibrionales bacterium]|nr:nucleotide pyrophosphatase/phosphodiesterase family protein [Bdellovibrionales bacterium]